MLTEAVLFCLLLLAYFILRDRKPRGMPPGPFEVPFLGNRPPLEEAHVLRLRETYGDVVTTRVGGQRNVLLFNYHHAKEALASPDCADRPDIFDAFSLDDRKKGGVLFANGHYWLHDRRFVLRNLRNLGMGRSTLEGAVQREAGALVDALRQFGGQPTPAPLILRTVPLNIIWQMVAGKRYPLESKEVMAVFETTQAFRKNFTVLAFLYAISPVLRKLTPGWIARPVFKAHLLENFMRDMSNIVGEHVMEHEKRLAEDDDGSEDLISEYLREMARTAGEEHSMFWRGSLLNNVNDLFGAGSDTVYHTLMWVVHCMAAHPPLVRLLQEEIDAVVPRGQPVTMEDKPRLPLVEAFATEVLRYSSIVGLNIQRTATKDMSIGGYHIPKGTAVQPVNLFIHTDPRLWEDPHAFRPQRFIDEHGRYRAPKEGFIAFGWGKRQCIGELLARMEVFVFSAALLQHFTVRLPEGAALSEEPPTMDGGLRCPPTQPLIYEYRG